MSNWIPFNYENEHKLIDHHFYLVATSWQNIPKIAKYHSDGSYFEIMPHRKPNNVYFIFDKGITHFMELPEMPSEEEVRARNDNI